MLAAVGLTAWMLGWLGTVLWSGRRIPKWFIAGFLLLTLAGPLVLAFLCNTWTESLASVGMVAMNAMGFRTVLRNYPGKPKAIDEL